MKHWNEILIKVDDTLEFAIKVMHSGGWQLALVVDDDRKLIGMITDGDLRRALIRQVSMKVNVGIVMNKSPITLSDRASHSDILNYMREKDLKHMPLLDDNGLIINLIAIEDYIKKDKIDNPVLLMAGGFGKRLHPITEDIPKPMVRVANKPILETILKRFIDQGFINFIFSLHYKPEIIINYFGDGSKWGIKISYVNEKKPLGTAGCLGLLDKLDESLPLIVMNGDLLTTANYKYLLAFHNKQSGGISICIKEHNIEIPFGVIEMEDNFLKNIVEKPIKKFNVNAGIYVLDTEVIKLIEKNKYTDMTDLLALYKKDDGRVNVFPLFEDWRDIGNKEDLNDAMKENKESY